MPVVYFRKIATKKPGGEIVLVSPFGFRIRNTFPNPKHLSESETPFGNRGAKPLFTRTCRASAPELALPGRGCRRWGWCARVGVVAVAGGWGGRCAVRRGRGGGNAGAVSRLGWFEDNARRGRRAVMFARLVYACASSFSRPPSGGMGVVGFGGGWGFGGQGSQTPAPSDAPEVHLNMYLLQPGVSCTPSGVNCTPSGVNCTPSGVSCTRRTRPPSMRTPMAAIDAASSLISRRR